MSGPWAYLEWFSRGPKRGQHKHCLNKLFPYNLVENASIEHSLWSSALKQLVVVVLEAVPMGSELLQAVFVDISEPV